MTCAEKCQQLREAIARELAPLLADACWLLEVPHYANVGDALIWQGELDFLRRQGIHCKGMTGYDSYRPPRIGDNDLVLFQGGGNFGDLWELPHSYRRRVMEQNPSCRFVVLPQTVHYADEANLLSDAAFFARFDCTICVRDMVSFKTLKRAFSNEVRLVPDMAFSMDMAPLAREAATGTGRPLLLKRVDREYRSDPRIDALVQSGGVDVADWTAIAEDSTFDRWRRRIRNHGRLLRWAYDGYMDRIYRPYLIRSGIRQLQAYSDIRTTRLHACILAVLLGKGRIALFDNSYGKNRFFYETWLQDCDSVKMMYG